MDTIYIKATRITNNCIEVNLETLLVVNVYNICDTENVNLVVVRDDGDGDDEWFKLFLNGTYSVVDNVDVPEVAHFCTWPVIIGDRVIAGLCSVCRQIIRSSKNDDVIHLLGFREASLMACTESSIWTKFCEIDITQTVKRVLQNKIIDDVILPSDMTRFEYHMQQPVRIHNVYKVAREKNNDKDIKSSVPLEELNVPHCYSEGPFLTLADVILYPCFTILLAIYDHTEPLLPLIHVWHKNMASQELNCVKFEPISKPVFNCRCPQLEHCTKVPRQSLYTSDPNRYKPQNRIYTKQNNIEFALKAVSESNLIIMNKIRPYGYEMAFDWDDIPIEANPMGGALPQKRAKRKCEQLQNLAKSVIKITADKNFKIVDFCSGSGHLGILLAKLLPRCQIILVENKERSLTRALQTCRVLNLDNVTLLQCNLDYFTASFDLGVSLHACGVATDLVIQNCIDNKAHFVSCPCCYGGIQDCYHLRYPRSEQFRSWIGSKDYFNMAHAADQTHGSDNAKTKQGYFCMDVVDTDRKLYAESRGYEVYLCKLHPTSCTPKNNLIVGILK